jgi:ubiquinone/menaquinone biosynthesis C-methylase UbiE
MEKRKQKEKDYANLRKGEISDSPEHVASFCSQEKWYSIVRKSTKCHEDWLRENCPNKKVLDYGCGNGKSLFKIAKMGASQMFGIDISDVSIENAIRKAREEGYDENLVKFLTMDAENTQFEDDCFDIIFEAGVLHHLELGSAYSELARLLRPNGHAICIEGLGHNPLIRHYRKKTPHLRTEWETEHILRKKDIEVASNYFHKVEILGFFHLVSIAAVPFRKLPVFNGILTVLETIDSLLLNLPILKWQAWQIVFVLSEPRKTYSK